MFVGLEGTGVVDQSGGLYSPTGITYIGHDSGSTGTYVFSGGLVTTRYDVAVGYSGTGIFSQSGGTLTLGDPDVVNPGFNAPNPVVLHIGYNSGTTATYTLTGGTLDATVGLVIVGQSGNGTFNQKGGTLTTRSNLLLGHDEGSSAIYNLDGGTLTTPQVQGSDGTSTFHFNGGTLRANQPTNTGDTAYTLIQNVTQVDVRNGGAIIDTQANDVNLGQSLLHSQNSSDNSLDGGLTKNGTGTLNIDGANTYTGPTKVNAGTLALGVGNIGVANSSSGLTVDSGSSTSTAAFTMGSGSNLTTVSTQIGTSGIGTLTQTGGTHAVTTMLLVGAGGTGTYSLSALTSQGPTLTAKEEDVGIGVGSVGTFNQTVTSLVNASNTTSTLYVGRASGTGTYTMTAGSGALNTGGSLNAGSTFVGFGGTGTFTQNGGTHTVSNALSLGTSGGTGTYGLNDGTLNAGSGDFGNGGTATFTLNQGTGQFDPSMATFTGALAVGSNNSGNGTVVQNNGTMKVGGTLSIGVSGGAGTYTLAGGSLSDNQATLGGSSGTAAFTQSGGSHTVVTSVSLGSDGGSGTYAMTGGTLSANYLYAGYSGSGSAAATVGTGQFTQSGGTVTLGTTLIGVSANSKGEYDLNGGTLITGGLHGLNGASTLELNGGTLQATASSTDFVSGVGTAQMGPGGAVVDSNGYDITVGQNIGTMTRQNQLDGGLTKNGSGTLTLTGNNGFNGGLHLDSGTVNVGSANALGVLQSNGVQGTTQGLLYFQGGTLQYSAANQQDYSYGFSRADNQQFQIDTNGQNVTFNSLLYGSGSSLTKLGAGTLTLNPNPLFGDAATYTGRTTLAGGTLALGGAGVLGPSGLISFVGGTLQYSSNNQVDYSGRTTTAENQAFNIDTNGQNVTYVHGLYSRNGTLTKLGNGTLTLASASTIIGHVVVNQGTLAVTAGVGASTLPASDLTVDSGVAASLSGGLTAFPTYNLGGGQSYFTNVSVGGKSYGEITQTGGTLNAGGILYLGYNGSQTYNDDGIYQLQSGTLNTHETQVGNAGQGTIIQSGGTHTVVNTLYVGLNSGNGTYDLSGSGALVANQGIVGYTGGANLSQTGGSASFGSGGLDIGNTAGSVGSYFMSTAGTGQTPTLDVTGTMTVGDGGTGTFGQSGSSTVNLHDNTLYLGRASGSTGTYHLDGGVLLAARVGTQGGTSTFNFNGGTLTPTQSLSDFLQGLTTANVRNGGMIVDTAGYDVAITQNVQHSSISGDNAIDGGLSKLGAGVLTITGDNTFTGPTSVQAGTLLADNTLGSGTGRGTVTVSAAAVLGGSGTLGGDVTALAGSTVEPGATPQPSVARLTVDGVLTFQPSSLLAIDIAGSTAGTGYDQVDAAGGFALGGDLQLTLQNGYVLTPGQSFTILDNTGNSSDTGVFANAADGIYTNAASQRFLIDYIANADGVIPNDVTATYVGVVPEPGVACSILLSAGLLVIRHRPRNTDRSARAS